MEHTYDDSNLVLLKDDKDLIPGILDLAAVIEKFKDVPDVEIELRLGFHNGDLEHPAFDTNVGDEFQKAITSVLNTFGGWDSTIKSDTTDYYTQGPVGNNIRLSIDSNGNRTAMQKVRLLDIDFEYDPSPFDIRISVSQEIPKDPMSLETCFDVGGDTNVTHSRQKSRTTFKHEAWSFDMSKVTSVENELSKTNYEVELEIGKPREALNRYNNNSQYLAHSTMIKLRQLIYMCEAPDKESNYMMQMLNRRERNHPVRYRTDSI